MWFLLFLFCIFIHKCAPQLLFTDITVKDPYQIVGIFDGVYYQEQQRAFNECTYQRQMGSFRLAPAILNPSRLNSYSVWKELCSDKAIKPIAIFGPQDPTSDEAVRDQCAIANIPHIQATWQPYDPDLAFNEEENSSYEEELSNGEAYNDYEESTDEEEEDEETNEEETNGEETNDKPIFKNITINFYPDSNEISLAYAKLLKYYNWEGFSALYEDKFGLLRIQKILAEHSKKHAIHLRKLDPDADNRNVFKDLNKYQDSSRFLLDCRAERILQYMDEAKRLNMVNPYQHYILANMDATIVAEQLVNYESNITWLSLTEYEKIIDPQYYLAPRVPKWSNRPTNAVPVSNFSLESLIMEDVSNHLLRALQNITEFEEPQNAICEQDAQPWVSGAQFQDAILKKTTTGVTGNIRFDDKGRRINYKLYVNEKYTLKKIQTIGRWESNGTEIIEERPSSDILSTQQTSKEFLIISRKAKPYFQNREECLKNENSCQNEDEKYEGFSVELVREIFKFLREEKFNFTYKFIDKDLQYGKFDKQIKKWDGLIGELLEKRADLAVCDLTITEDRKKVVDFSVPFMSLGISILYTKDLAILAPDRADLAVCDLTITEDRKKVVDFSVPFMSLGISILYTKDNAVPPPMFSFLNPYTFDVWMYTATAYCVVSIVLFICARISPADWENPQPCDKDPEELENIWNFKNCTWLTMGSIMTQGCDILPKAIGTRWVCAMWWFFAVIVCQTYIAQLSASMTSALENEPINSIEDLAKQTKIRYGAIEGGSTYDFFQASKDKTYRKIFETMEANPGVFVTSNDIGEKRVLKSKNKYAFFMESTTIEYKIKRNCELKKVGGELDSKDYGIAMPANSPYRSHINRAILRLKELTKLDEIKAKWWNEKYGAVECEEKPDVNDIEGDLEMENLIGAFVVLIVGLVFCLFVTAAEFMDEIRNIVVREQMTHKEAMIQELKASLNFFQLQKPVLRNPSRAPSAVSRASSEKTENRAAFIGNFLELEKEAQQF